MNIADIRSQFPALQQTIEGRTPIFFDGPGGAQVSQQVLSAMTDYLGLSNANLGAPYFSSRQTMDVMATARQNMAALLNSPSAEQIVFGPTATNLMFSFSRVISRDWQAGDEIIVTALDHYSNVSSWVQAAEDKGVTVYQLPVDTNTFDLDYTALAQLVNQRTRLIAVTHASNTTGTIVDVAKIIELAKSVNALSFIDAVHYAPHHLLDVQALDCDFLVVSAYKFTGPHIAALYAKSAHLEQLTPYKVEPAADINPNRWEQGTQNFEGMAGLNACIEYLASISVSDSNASLRQRLTNSFSAIVHHETQLSEYFLARLSDYEQVSLFGKPIARNRTPTFAFRINGDLPRAFAEFCGKRAVCIGDGHFYAKGLCEQLGVMDTGGVIRIGCLHYNTTAEIDHCFDCLDEYLSNKMKI